VLTNVEIAIFCESDFQGEEAKQILTPNIFTPLKSGAPIFTSSGGLVDLY